MQLYGVQGLLPFAVLHKVTANACASGVLYFAALQLCCTVLLSGWLCVW
jgi:hypothetical protein